jgi:hypothetical protein
MPQFVALLIEGPFMSTTTKNIYAELTTAVAEVGEGFELPDVRTRLQAIPMQEKQRLALLAALDLSIPQVISKGLPHPSPVSWWGMFGDLAHQLSEERSMPLSQARWAVEAWAYSIQKYLGFATKHFKSRPIGRMVAADEHRRWAEINTSRDPRALERIAKAFRDTLGVQLSMQKLYRRQGGFRSLGDRYGVKYWFAWDGHREELHYEIYHPMSSTKRGMINDAGVVTKLSADPGLRFEAPRGVTRL